jgi:hypothetical protein
LSSKYPHEFDPITVRGVYYKNCLAQAPPGCAGRRDENSFVTPEFIKFFDQFARGGGSLS